MVIVLNICYNKQGDIMNDNIFCVDIGGSKLICGAINQKGEILDTYRVDYPKNYTVDMILDYISEGYKKLSAYSYGVCGVAIPGLCDYKTGEWLYSPFSKIGGIKITEKISEIIGLPVFADNDVNISALAEKHFGVCKDVSDFLWITVSNGIGGGLYLNGELYRGQKLSAGEIGHFIVEENGRLCGCGNRGCLEAHSSGASISSIYAELTGKQISAKDIADLARSGDKIALKVWQDAGTYIGKAVSYAINLLGIDTVVLGGGAAEAFDLLAPAVNNSAEKYLFKKANPQIKILHSKPGKYAALMGCAALALENIS